MYARILFKHILPHHPCFIGVVTFEPTKFTRSKGETVADSAPPSLRGVRSRVVNAKRTDLSKKVRRKIVNDNCERLTGNLRGFDKPEYTVNTGGGRLVRGFFGHTRFATSSKATFDGTHPHQWSKRRDYNIFPFSSSSSGNACIGSRRMGVENFITHNGGECYA